MIKLYLSAVLILLGFLGKAQECEGTFVFNHQSDMDAFLINNPGCTSIIGDVFIEPQNNGGPDDLLSVDGLQNITHIVGNLSIGFQGNDIDFTLSFASFSNLESVSGLIFVGDYASQPHIVSLTGFESLTFCEELFIQDCYGIESLEPFYQLEQTTGIACVWTYSIPKSISLTNLFPNLTDVSGGIAFEGASYPEFTGFDNLMSADAISISGYDSFANESIENFDAFPELLSCFSVYIDMDITEMHGFESLSNITFMSIHVNSQNPYWNFDSLSSAVEIELKNEMSCQSTPTFPALTELNSAYGGIRTLGLFENVVFSSLQSTGYFDVMGNGSGNGPNTIQCPELIVIHGDLLIAHTEVYEVQFLNNVNTLGAFVSLNSNHNLSLCDQEVLCYKIANESSSVFIYDNAPGCYDLSEASSNCNFSTAQGIVFIDLNCDGILNDQDYNYPQTVILQNQNGVAVEIYNPGQVYSLPLTQGSQVITCVAPDGYTTNNTYTYLENDPGSFIDQNYALCPEPNLNNIELVIVPEQSPRPGFSNNYFIRLTNLGINEATAQIDLDFSSAPGMSVQSVSGNGAINGNIVTWTTPSLGAFAMATYYIECVVNATVPLGEIYTITGTANITFPMGNDSYPDNNQSVVTQTVIGSYDPNDISVHRTDIPVEEINTGDPITLDYLIRFQNTGTAEAINVRIENPLSSLLDVSTLQVLSSSHDYEIEIHDNSTLHWKFDDIYLPDSATNALASQGYVLYRIKTQSGLGLTDSIHNHAEIYFDFNEPVITNTAITSFYECPTNTQIIGPLTTCADETIILTCNSEYDQYAWTMDGMSLSESSELQMADITAGTYTIVLSATSQFCEAEVEHILVVHTVPTAPVITQNITTLSASGSGEFHWQLNGEDLATTNSTVEMTESGVYSVFVVENGCPSAQTSGQFIMSSTSEHALKNEFTVYPQPANDEIFITHNTSRSGAYTIEIHDLSGRLLFQSNMNNSTLRIDCSPFETGLYMCSIKNELNKNVSQYKLIVQ